jgi:hypothetical protein
MQVPPSALARCESNVAQSANLGGCRWQLHMALQAADGGCMAAADGQMQMARCSRLPLARFY